MSRFNNEYKRWRRAVLDKCGSKCVRCGAFEKLHAHHIKPWAGFPTLRFSVENGEVLCVWCHIEVHPFMAKYYDAEGNPLKKRKPRRRAKNKRLQTRAKPKTNPKLLKALDNYKNHRFSKYNPNPNWSYGGRSVYQLHQELDAKMRERVNLDNT